MKNLFSVDSSILRVFLFKLRFTFHQLNGSISPLFTLQRRNLGGFGGREHRGTGYENG